MSDTNDNLYPDEEIEDVGDGPKTVPEKSKLENVSGLASNPKTSKPFILTVGAVGVVAVIAVIGIWSRNTAPPPPMPAAIAGAADVGQAPRGLNEDRNAALAQQQQYKGIVAAASQERASQAAATGESVQPLALTVEGQLKPTLTPAQAAASAAVAEKQREADAAAAAATQQAATQQVAYSAQQPQQVDPAYQAMMQKAAEAMSGVISYGNRTHTAMVVDMRPSSTEGAAGMTSTPAVLTANASQAKGQAGGAAAAGAAAASSSTSAGVTLLYAGDLEAASMDSAVNTDVSSRFVATLATGKYAGAKILGSVTRKGELAQLQCSMISFPNQGVSVPAQCDILDAETSEPGTATDVDRKLFVKYGIKPLAAGFAVVADYLKTSGTTVNITGETVATTVPPLTGKKTAEIVAGSAAGAISTDANALDTTPTVRVARHTIVGVQFTSDVIYTPKTR